MLPEDSLNIIEVLTRDDASLQRMQAKKNHQRSRRRWPSASGYATGAQASAEHAKQILYFLIWTCYEWTFSAKCAYKMEPINSTVCV